MIVNGLDDRHRQEIRQTITDIFGRESIETAFITGSIPAGKARPTSDIDIFVCLNTPAEPLGSKRRHFIDFYFELHERLGRESDPVSPGEILTLSNLRAAIERIQAVVPSKTLKERDDFDAICWAGMLVSKRDVLIPSSKEIRLLEEASRRITSAWASKLVPNTTPTEGTGEYSDLDKILRKTVSCPGYYDAH